MATSRSQRSSRGSSRDPRFRLRITGAGLLVAAAAVLLGFLAFLNARAGVGLLVLPETRWGPGFDVVRPQLAIFQVRQGLRQAERASVEAREAMEQFLQASPEVQGVLDQMQAIPSTSPTKADPDADRALERVAISSLEQAPLNARALRILALNDDFAGRTDAAATKMAMVDRISRRDSVAQLWLANRSALQGDVKATLQHLDVLLRVRTQESGPLFERLAATLMLPDGRAALRPFIVAETPWLERFFLVALERAPSAQPLGELIASLDKVPDVKALHNSYRMLVLRLATEKDYGLLRQVYQNLPEVEEADLYSVSLSSAAAGRGYVPAIWDFGTRSERGGAMVGPDQAEFFAIGDVRGVAGSKLVFFRSANPHELSFTKVDGEPGDETQAFVQIGCVLGKAAGVQVTSTNLLDVANGSARKLQIPGDCDAALVEILVDGGSRRQPTRLVLSNLRLSS